MRKKFSPALGIQVESLPAGALGPKFGSTQPSAFICIVDLS